MIKLIISILLMLPTVLFVFALIIHKIIISPLPEIKTITMISIILVFLFIIGFCMFFNWCIERKTDD